MMNKVFGLFLLLFLASCSETTVDDYVVEKDETLVDNFTISGAIKNGSNLTFYLDQVLPGTRVTVAEVKSDSQGKFKLVGNIPDLGLYQLRLGETNENIIPLTLVPNDNLSISSTVDEFSTSPTLTGTSWSRVMTDYTKIYSDFHFAQIELMQKKGSMSNLEITKEYKRLKAHVDSFAIAEINAEPGNPFNILLFDYATPSMGYNDWDADNLDLLNKVCDAFMKSYPDAPVSSTLSSQTFEIETAYKKHLANTSGIYAAPEIALNNPEGVELKLSSLQGKYVLIDFWASWCGPCRRESPNVVRLYNEFKDKGFTVFSVSLDDKLEAWKGAIVADGLAWPNHVSDLLNWNSPLPQLYGFTGIPHTVLLNPEGKIIGVGLKGESLEQKLNEIFSK